MSNDHPGHATSHASGGTSDAPDSDAQHRGSSAEPAESARTTHPRIAELLRELDASREELFAYVRSIPAASHTQSGANGAWSIAQNLEHLAITEDATGRAISRIVREVEGTGAQETDTTTVLHGNDHYLIGGSDERLNAPAFVLPSDGLSVDDSVAKLTASRVLVKRALMRGSGLALGTATIPHPLFGPFNGYQWALMIAQHERRHLRQIQRTLALTDTNDSGITA